MKQYSRPLKPDIVYLPINDLEDNESYARVHRRHPEDPALLELGNNGGESGRSIAHGLSPLDKRQVKGSIKYGAKAKVMQGIYRHIDSA